MVIMHVDVNSAFLSWSAVKALEDGSDTDLRTIPSAVAGDRASRHGIILAKSIPAKKYGIKTAETVAEALRKCPQLVMIPPDRDLYVRCSRAMVAILQEYSTCIERFSIDECFLEYAGGGAHPSDPVQAAYEIKDRIKNELGFTVNVGVSVNKILAKMGSEMEKPDKVHTLFPEEIPEKLWPQPVGDLFMVGKSSAAKLVSYNIKTIGDLARSEKRFIHSILKSHGDLIWNYANGIDGSRVTPNGLTVEKSVGNSVTIDHDVSDRAEAKRILLQLSEKVGGRLRALGTTASQVSVTIKTSDFISYSHQLQLGEYTDVTGDIYDNACWLFDECWRGEPIRLLGVSVSGLNYSGEEQLSIFGTKAREENSRADKVVDEIRERFGKGAITRGSLVSRDAVRDKSGPED